MNDRIDSRVRLDALAEADFASLRTLAHAIWRAHYTQIVGRAQVDFMLGARFTPDNLRRYLESSERWMKVLRRDGREVGYCSYALTPVPGELKLEQLYLLPELHGLGLGRFMLGEIEANARKLGCQAIVLQVNKRNTLALAVYRKSGFIEREQVVLDIGNGFVMDDFILVKSL